MNEIVKLNNLNIKVNKHNTLVNNVSLKIKKGEIYGLVGESGSGKTLTAKAIINLLPDNLSYSADEICIDGENINNISKLDKKSLIGKNIGFIPQNTIFFLHPMIKIKNQISDGYIKHMKRSKTEGLKKASEILKKVGFNDPNTILNYYPWQLSGGMRQRVNIAMAIMNDPKLIIADEPTTALDSTIQRQVIELFKTINEEMGISILMISHDLGLIKHYCHSLSVMYAGQIVESGLADEVFNNPKHPYTELLIKIIPSFKIKKNKPLSEIPGYVQEIGREREGCIFMDRCPKAMDICSKSVSEYNINNHYYKCNIE
ncbi:ABC transporter ATP-binding protein [Sedimentibacter sp. MB31-C6]|uniref:ABC transporter ATP-binding protein n=1 Tax=Sedimentibacter sp. MB31-C6 TaxID=3109366 RepID=UPI002DDD66C5|nr:ABC transporter ATP-binding protein [Sedimentibacter sp. MB36-C1]WSI02997.1 ABC transporter ATP-binding protein [Sedimentibacter sp. MB36-C1]